jgi:hypothetical protein
MDTGDCETVAGFLSTAPSIIVNWPWQFSRVQPITVQSLRVVKCVPGV